MESVINKRVKEFEKITDIIQTIVIYLVALQVPTFLAK